MCGLGWESPTLTLTQEVFWHSDLFICVAEASDVRKWMVVGGIISLQGVMSLLLATLSGSGQQVVGLLVMLISEVRWPLRNSYP